MASDWLPLARVDLNLGRLDCTLDNLEAEVGVLQGFQRPD